MSLFIKTIHGNGHAPTVDVSIHNISDFITGKTENSGWVEVRTSDGQMAMLFLPHALAERIAATFAEYKSEQREKEVSA